MRKRLFPAAAIAALAILSSTAGAAVVLGTPFKDKAVLQRRMEVPVWGRADPGERVEVSFGDARAATVAGADGRWMVRLPPMEASTEGRALAANDARIEDVLVGEVWFCAGQSNTELPLKGLDDNPHFADREGRMTAQITREPQVRYAYCSDYQWSVAPLDEYRGDFTAWKEFVPANLGADPSFSAMGVYFALQIHNTLDIPVGIVGTYWGGTCIEAWTPKEGFEGIPSLEPIAKYPVTADWDSSLAMGPVNGAHQQPSVLFNEMVNPWTPYAARGLIWYQGCNNSADGALYADKMHALYNGWSKKFLNPGLKLYFVQLAPWAESFFDIQLAQEKFADEEPNAGLVPTCDIGNTWDIHPNEKGTVGRRLAMLALARDYGFDDIVCDYPRVEKARVEGGTVVLTCSHADVWQLYDRDWGVEVPFEVRGADGVWKKARLLNANDGRETPAPWFTRGEVKGAELLVASSEVPAPVAVRYLHERPWMGNLYAGSGLPLAPFEIEIPVAPAPAAAAPAADAAGASSAPEPDTSAPAPAPAPSAPGIAPSFGTPFTEHAVLQRGCPIPVWGTATPGATVTVSLDGAPLDAVADEAGRWLVRFPARNDPGLGHALRLSSEGREYAAFADIAIGDVWICSGQSNMAMNYMGGLTRGREDIETKSFDDIRLFNEMEAFSLRPLARYPRPAAWARCDFESARGFSACGYFFAQALHEALPGIPLGIVNASWAGSAISTWMSDAAYARSNPYCASVMETVARQRADFEAGGGKAGFEARVARWRKECDEKGAIPAERPDFDDSGWNTVALPGAIEGHFGADFDGCAWYRRTVALSAEQAARPAAILLGAVDDFDWTYVNGILVGHSIVWNEQRRYAIPAGTLHEGLNTISVRVVDNGGGGGFYGDASGLAIALDGAGPVSLAGEWRATGFPFAARPVDPTEIQYWSPSVCFNAMIHPLFPMAAKGVIWYQGCSDVGDAPRYGDELRSMVAEWREGFTSPDGLPFFIVQLAAFQQTHDQPVETAWADFRWEQMRLGEEIEKSGTAVLLDVGDHDDIHPKDKKTVGERLARLALVRAYGREDMADAGPIPESARRTEGGKVAVSFRGAPPLATADGAPVRGFQLAGADGRYAWATAVIDGARVAIDVPEGQEPASVRYAWDDYPDCNLVGPDALPCGPFQLDIGR